MKFLKTKLLGVYIIELEKREDDRGLLIRTWDKEEFAKNGINLDLLQGYVCYTAKKGTVRGLHYRNSYPLIAQLTKCLSGAYYEVVVDLRKDSKTYKQWEGFTLRADEGKMLYIPEGLAHAVLTLENDTLYMNYYSGFYKPEVESGIRYNDASFNIKWPIPVDVVSDKDMSWEDFNDNR